MVATVAVFSTRLTDSDVPLVPGTDRSPAETWVLPVSRFTPTGPRLEVSATLNAVVSRVTVTGAEAMFAGSDVPGLVVQAVASPKHAPIWAGPLTPDRVVARSKFSAGVDCPLVRAVP